MAGRLGNTLRMAGLSALVSLGAAGILGGCGRENTTPSTTNSPTQTEQENVSEQDNLSSEQREAVIINRITNLYNKVSAFEDSRRIRLGLPERDKEKVQDNNFYYDGKKMNINGIDDLDHAFVMLFPSNYFKGENKQIQIVFGYKSRYLKNLEISRNGINFNTYFINTSIYYTPGSTNPLRFSMKKHIPGNTNTNSPNTMDITSKESAKEEYKKILKVFENMEKRYTDYSVDN